MFKSDLIESLSKVHYAVPLILYIPLIGYLFYKALGELHVGFMIFFLSLAGGLLSWTLTEYVLHRFVFHYMPSSEWGKKLHFIFHGVHHDFPNDRLRLVMPPSVSIPLALFFFFIFKYSLSIEYLYGFFGAFLIGYLFYDTTHYAIHHANFKNPLLKKLKHHHMTHHFSEPNKGYGVSSKLWDKIFGSDFPR